MFFVILYILKIVGTDGQQTCVGLVIRNPKTGRISVAHIIYSYIVEVGLTQMLSSICDEESDDILDVHIIGGYNTSPQQSCRTWDGTSTFICLKIVEVLWKSNKRFNIQTMYILNDNTIYDEEGNAYPFLKGFLVETGNGSIFPATFHETTKGPDEYIRRIRERACLRDPNWDNRLLETYDIESDQFTIAYVSRGKRYLKYIESLRNQSDEELCNTYLTVPIPMTPHNIFVIRRDLEKLFQVPNWEEVFPFRRPRTFFRSIDGGWAMRTSEHNQILKRTANRVCQGRYNIQ
ncbi:unnamed protein product [Cuscuta epithymum]|uniref:Uncharacterized protein n=2 Tax=Cuscuta epithymum TaxID=186058 RepID=A0AAV0DIF5_9ASTE|nr:unnamed protein product [Cuscuta epithymum]